MHVNIETRGTAGTCGLEDERRAALRACAYANESMRELGKFIIRRKHRVPPHTVVSPHTFIGQCTYSKALCIIKKNREQSTIQNVSHYDARSVVGHVRRSKREN